MTAVLWHIELSHYNEKARWALDYKRLPHRRKTPLPGLHRPRALALTRGAHSRLPIVDLDGRRVGDSAAIIEALERHQPDPPLYPSDPAERRRALELERYFGEELGPRLRGFYWHYTLADPELAIDSLIPGASSARKGFIRGAYPLASRVARRDYDANDAAVREARAGVLAAMDRLEEELRPNGHLAGEGFSVADLAAAAMFTPVLAPPERPYAPVRLAPEVATLREELEARPGGAWVTSTYASYRGVSAEVS